jgi:hypothetical protein
MTNSRALLPAALLAALLLAPSSSAAHGGGRPAAWGAPPPPAPVGVAVILPPVPAWVAPYAPPPPVLAGTPAAVALRYRWLEATRAAFLARWGHVPWRVARLEGWYRGYRAALDRRWAWAAPPHRGPAWHGHEGMERGRGGHGGEHRD